MPADVAEALLALARTFEEIGVRWYVFGAQAVIAAGVPRLTADIDVTVEVPPGGPPALLDALARSGFSVRDVGDLETFMAETRVVPALHQASNLPVDLVLAGPGLEEEMLSRASLRPIRGVGVPFVDLADLVALKVLAGREKDLDDVRALARASPSGLSFDVARQRLTVLAELLADSTLVAKLDDILGRGAPRKPSAKRRRTPKRR